MSEKISIIIPAYNLENEIVRCVNSVLAQTYQNIEVIVVNDGSTDGTLEELRKLEIIDKRLVIIDKKNEGVTLARLTGVNYASGEWIGFIDGDDYIDDEMYEHLLRNACKYNADISHCGYQMVFPSRVDYYYNSGKLVQQDTFTGMKDLLSGVFVEPGLCNKLYRKELFADILKGARLDKTVKNFEDLLMNYYLFKAAKSSIYEDFCPYYYIVRSDSAANSNPYKLHDWIKVTEILIEETKNDNQLCKIMQNKLVRQLIAVSTNKKLASDVVLRKGALRRLRKNSFSIIFNNIYERKIRIMTLIACASPTLYEMLHSKYQSTRGLDKKYDIS